MKLNQKIYKAIQTGLNEALSNLSIDDFDDIEISDNNISDEHEDISTQSGQDEHEKWSWIKENFVDLGLPSRTLWCKWNIGAINDDTPESWYGGYYAWGEVRQKLVYSSSTYTANNLDKYEQSMSLDNDVAHQTDGYMHIPSVEQFNELCKLEKKSVYNYNKVIGLNGVLFIGNNGNELFIPAGGIINNGEDVEQGEKTCNLWCNTMVNPDTQTLLRRLSHKTDNYYDAHSFYFDVAHPDNFGTWDRRWYYGLNVRGVINKYQVS